jgi:long-chain acyl-CoA synthetase
MVIGEGQKMPAALVHPDFLFLKAWCAKKKIPYTTDAEMISNQLVIDRFQQEIETLNESFSNFEKIKKQELIGAVWSIDGGELTPTLKLKRKNVLAKYQALYNKIYC